MSGRSEKGISRDEEAKSPISLDLDSLPSDLRFLHQLIRDLVDHLKTKDGEIERLKGRVEQMVRHRYGKRSEKCDPNQMLLFEELIDQVVGAGDENEEAGGKSEGSDEDEEPSQQSPRRKRKGHGRKPLPDHLERRVELIPVPPEDLFCDDCGSSLVVIGHEISEQLEYEPAHFYVKQKMREKRACRPCQGNVRIADLPITPILKGIPGEGLLAHVITSKYCDHLPLNRIEGIVERSGVEVSKSTMCGWIAKCSELLKPITLHMKSAILRSYNVHTDDTPVPVLDKSKDRTRRGHLWVYVGDEDHPHVFFDFTANWGKAGPAKILAGFEGYLQADGYTGYDHLYKAGKIVEVACWAHARRKFYDSLTTDESRACVALAFIGVLYDIEKVIKDLSLEEKESIRKEKGRENLDLFRDWLLEEKEKVLPQSKIGLAIKYALNQWTALGRYIDDGRLAIDNNPAERQIRRITVGRANWLFAGSDEGGHRAAVMYSIVASCQRHGVDPFLYIRDVLVRVSTHPISRIDELTPAGWKAAFMSEVQTSSEIALAGA